MSVRRITRRATAPAGPPAAFRPSPPTPPTAHAGAAGQTAPVLDSPPSSAPVEVVTTGGVDGGTVTGSPITYPSA